MVGCSKPYAVTWHAFHPIQKALGTIPVHHTWIHYPSSSPLPISHLPPNFIVTTCGNLSEQRLIFISVNYCVDTSYRWFPAFISYIHLQLLVNRERKGGGICNIEFLIFMKQFLFSIA